VGEQEQQLAHKNTGIALRQIDGGRIEIGPLVESL
jgi:DNA-directed RNA polymerase subunit K/omega